VEKGPAFLGRIVECLAIDKVKVEAALGGERRGKGGVVESVRLAPLVDLEWERFLRHRKTEVGRALIAGQLLGLLRAFLHDLDTGCAGAYDSDALADQVDAFLRPFLIVSPIAPSSLP
jgi:hypothetical protein